MQRKHEYKLAMKRALLFPEITDWTLPQTHIRQIPVKKMSMKQFFYFHPIPYFIIAYLTPLINSITFGILAIVLSKIWNGWIALFPWLISAFSLWVFIKKIPEYRYEKGKTMYDYQLREYVWSTDGILGKEA